MNPKPRLPTNQTLQSSVLEILLTTSSRSLGWISWPSSISSPGPIPDESKLRCSKCDAVASCITLAGNLSISNCPSSPFHSLVGTLQPSQSSYPGHQYPTTSCDERNMSTKPYPLSLHPEHEPQSSKIVIVLSEFQTYIRYLCAWILSILTIKSRCVCLLP